MRGQKGKQKDKEWSWVGQGHEEDDECHYYEGVRVHNEVYTVGDDVILQGKVPYGQVQVAKVLKMYTNKVKDEIVCQNYWRAKDLLSSEHETRVISDGYVLLTNVEEVYPVTSLVSPAYVRHLHTLEEPEAWLEAGEYRFVFSQWVHVARQQVFDVDVLGILHFAASDMESEEEDVAIVLKEEPEYDIDNVHGVESENQKSKEKKQVIESKKQGILVTPSSIIPVSPVQLRHVSKRAKAMLMASSPIAAKHLLDPPAVEVRKKRKTAKRVSFSDTVDIEFLQTEEEDAF